MRFQTMEEFHQVNNFSQICNALNFMLKSEMIVFKFEVCIFFLHLEIYEVRNTNLVNIKTHKYKH